MPSDRARRLLWSLLCLVSLAACGGGGGGGPGGTPGPDPEIIVDGLTGHVLMADFDVGRIVEQEPNDTRAQPFRLPPFWPRTELEVTGDLAQTAAYTQAVDPADVFRFTAVEGQTISLALEFPALDVLTATPNDFHVEVFRRATGASLAVSGPGNPRTLIFDAAAGEAYDVVVTLLAGHGWYVLRLTGADLVAGPLVKPSALRARTPAAPPAPGGAAPRLCAGSHVLVRFAPGCDAERVCAAEGLVLGRRTGGGSHRVHFAPGADGEAEAAALCERLDGVEGVLWAEPDWVVRRLAEPSDPEYGRQWNLRAIGAPSAWDVTRGDENIVIAVVDGGITDHPDLAGALVPGYDFVSAPEFSGDGDGRDPDPTDPGDGGRGSGLSVWHGTHVTSLLVARDGDGYGITGVAPRCRAMMLRALGQGGGLVSDAADAILYAAALYAVGEAPDEVSLPAPVRIINLSIGLDADSTELREACDRARNVGCFLVAAVGNNGGAVQYPAAYDSTFAVAGVDGKLLTTNFSSFGPAVDLAAPSGGGSFDQWNDGWHDGVLGALRDETVDPATWGHGYLTGTSQAAPHVAGAAALMLSVDPALSNAELRAILRATALDRGAPGDDVAYGRGVLQVHEALKLVLAQLGTPRTDPPRLLLSTRSVQFEGFRSSIEVPLMNAGGGILDVFDFVEETDNGAPWLSAQRVDADGPMPPSNAKAVRIEVNRSDPSLVPGRHSATLRVRNAAGILGALRIVVYVGQRTRAGQILPVVAIDAASGIARRRGYAYPEFGYRYWLRDMPAAMYRLKSGEDLDGDGIFCEAPDACGWHGGPTEMDAIPVEFVPGGPAVQGLSINLLPPP